MLGRSAETTRRVRAEVPHPGAGLIVVSQRYSTLNNNHDHQTLLPPSSWLVVTSVLPGPAPLSPCTPSTYHKHRRPSGTSLPPHYAGVCVRGDH